MVRPAPAPLSLKARALRLLSQREHSRAELQRKLQPHATEPDALAQLLDELQSRQWLSDERAAASLLHRRAAGLGQARLRQELQQQGLARELIAEALAGLPEAAGSELERARQVWQKKFGKAASDAKEQLRQTRFLLARGFAAEVVRQVIQSPADSEP